MENHYLSRTAVHTAKLEFIFYRTLLFPKKKLCISEYGDSFKSPEMKDLIGYIAGYCEDLEKTLTDEQKNFEKFDDCNNY